MSADAGSLEIVAGGAPPPPELAALVVAISAPLRTAGTAARDAGSTAPAWTRAALLEGVGGGPFAAPDELRPGASRMV